MTAIFLQSLVIILSNIKNENPVRKFVFRDRHERLTFFKAKLSRPAINVAAFVPDLTYKLRDRTVKLTL